MMVGVRHCEPEAKQPRSQAFAPGLLRCARNDGRLPSRSCFGRHGTATALALVFGLAFLAPARAVEPDEILANPVLEARARTISVGLRCLVCQNESIDDSHAELARDIRLLVRRRLEAGDTNAQVIDYLVARYGQFILLKPPFEPQTLLLWGTPLIVLLLGGGAMALAARRKPARDPARPLSEAERRRLDEMLGDAKP